MKITSKPRFSLLVPLSLCVLSASSCDDEDPPEPAERVSEFVGQDLELLTSVESPEGVEVSFHAIGNGGVIVSEYGPAEAPSPLTYFNAVERATPLELFTALAPDQDPPAALVVNHEALKWNRNQSLVPRELHLPDPSFRSTNEQYYNTDCSYSGDKEWFDYWWDLWDLSWHPYYSGEYSGEKQTSETPGFTDAFITHLCLFQVYDENHDPIGAVPVDHYVKNPTSGYLTPGFGQQVYIAHRSVLGVFDVTGIYRGVGTVLPLNTAVFRLGAMADTFAPP